MGAEIGYWYLEQRKLQNAADVTAHATALRMSAGASDAEIQTMADYMAARADVDLGLTVVGFNMPPGSGAFAGDATAIEIVLTRTMPRMFSAIYSTDPVIITVRAVAQANAGTAGGTACVLALSETDPQALRVWGSTTVGLDSCQFVSNAGFEAGGSASGTAECVRAAGSVTMVPAITLDCDAPEENAAATPDPYSGVVEPQATGACQSSSVGHNSQARTVTPVEAHASGNYPPPPCAEGSGMIHGWDES